MLTRENYKIIAAKSYKSLVLADSDFEKDLSLLNRISNRIEVFCETGVMPTKRLANYLVISINCFGQEFVCDALFLNVQSKYSDALLTFLEFFGFKEEFVFIDGKETATETIPLNKAMRIRLNEELGEF